MAEKEEKELRADLLAALFVFYVKNSIRNDGCSGFFTIFEPK